MHERLDLTTKPPPKKWFSKARLILIAITLVLLALLIFVVDKVNSADSSEYAYGEDQLPAIKVNVLNGCGFDQLAADFARSLSHKNIDVISLGNTPRPIYDKSIIVMRKADKQDLARLQKMTGIQRWTSALSEYHSADFDIIVGRDYQEFMK
jgi:hypothetical protein